MAAKKKDRAKIVEKVLARDGSRCVVCGSKDGLTAHHLIEKKLWDQESAHGYLADNLVTICPGCHWLAEKTLLSADKLRKLAGIETVNIPEDLDPGKTYDKWGNEVLPGGKRVPGKLFDLPEVQKLLREAGLLHLFYWEVA